jgi:hypothetical protein
LALQTAEFPRLGTGWGRRLMAGGASGVGEVRLVPDALHAFTMAICRVDGSSGEEARLVADHLVLANLFGHDSHGVGLPSYIQNTTTGHCVRNQHAKIVCDNSAVVVIDGGAGYGQPATSAARTAASLRSMRVLGHADRKHFVLSPQTVIYSTAILPQCAKAMANRPKRI